MTSQKLLQFMHSVKRFVELLEMGRPDDLPGQMTFQWLGVRAPDSEEGIPPECEEKSPGVANRGEGA